MIKSKLTRICALVPTYNNAGTIIDVLRRVHVHVRDIIVVNDGCTDDTAALLANLDFPVTVVTHTHNKGKGKALVSGFRQAIRMGFAYAITIDADGQHYPEDIPILLRAHDVHPNAMIIGSRQFTDENMSGKSKFANRFSNFWFKLQTTISLPDTQSGMRLYPLDKLYGLNILTSRYEAELELLVFAAWRNVPLIPVPVRVYYPPQEERVSHFRPAKDFTRISILNCFLCIGAILFGYINMYWRAVACFLYFGLTMLLFVNPYTLLYFLFHGRNAKSRREYHTFVWKMAQHYTRWLAGLRLNKDTWTNETQSIVIANHQSYLDIMACLSLTPMLTPVVKGFVWNSPIFGVVARYMGAFPTSYDDEKREAAVKQILDEGYSLLVFPEGTRTATGEIGRFHRGAFYYAEQYGLPVKPLVLQGMTDYMAKGQWALKPADVRLRIFPSVPQEDRSWGANYKKRAKSFERFYHSLMHSNGVRVSILGAGVSGLITGALLAQRGYEVTILEQLPVYGGGLYSYEREGETWLTGMHILSGLEPDGPVTQLLDSLGIRAHVVPTTVDHDPSELIGHAEWSQTKQLYRFIGGSQTLADDLAFFIVRHGGMIVLGEKVREIRDMQIEGSTAAWPYDLIVSTLHPKQLLSLTELPIYRPATKKRILATPETQGSFKIYVRLKPDTLPYDPVTHYLPKQHLLVFTPCAQENQAFARTIETVMPLDYSELSAWHEDRKANYDAYEAYKHRKEQEVLDLIESVYPDIRQQMIDVFSSTSLTYRDDYLSPEGAMFGMREPVGSVRTHHKQIYISGQNVFLHGLCGVAMTAQLTAQAICEDTL